jgi:hypothetical protein
MFKRNIDMKEQQALTGAKRWDKGQYEEAFTSKAKLCYSSDVFIVICTLKGRRTRSTVYAIGRIEGTITGHVNST